MATSRAVYTAILPPSTRVANARSVADLSWVADQVLVDGDIVERGKHDQLPAA